MTVQSRELLNHRGGQDVTGLCRDDIGRYVLLPGDPLRTDLIARHFERPRLVSHQREVRAWTGFLNGVRVSAVSTGMGCPSTAIVTEELIHLGADTLLRIGTCGSVCEDSENPSLEGVIITGAVRDEGTTIQYLPIEYPALANRHIVAALAEAAALRGWSYAEGIAQCKDSFYGELEPYGMPLARQLNTRWEAWRRCNVMASEMETAALFIVSALRGARAGAVLAYREMGEHTVALACDAFKTLIAQDQAAEGGETKPPQFYKGEQSL